MTAASWVLEVDSVAKSYGAFQAVKELSFSLRPGEVFGFLGPNGAGKTSTIRMILGILKPDRGAIRILGAPWDRSSLKHIGYLPEERGLYRQMTALSTIVYFAGLKGIPSGEARRRGMDLLTRFGLKEAAHKRLASLSKGMAQKIQLAVAIVHEPGLLILDEPFSGLDPLNQQALEDIIREQTQHGRSVLFSTHTMQHAERLCDRLMIVNKGAAAFSGTLAEARSTFPKRVRLEGEGDFGFLHSLPGVKEVHDPRPGHPYWEVVLEPGTKPRVVLEACFAKGIALTRFDASEPSLHEIFVSIVGEEAAGKENEP